MGVTDQHPPLGQQQKGDREIDQPKRQIAQERTAACLCLKPPHDGRGKGRQAAGERREAIRPGGRIQQRGPALGQPFGFARPDKCVDLGNQPVGAGIGLLRKDRRHPQPRQFLFQRGTAAGNRGRFLFAFWWGAEGVDLAAQRGDPTRVGLLIAEKGVTP